MKANISRLFLLPGIQLDEKAKRDFSRFGFENTYLKCDQLSYAFNVIFLLFKPNDLDLEFYTFAKNMEKNPNFIEAIDLGRNKVVMVYRIPKRFTKDYELFLEGKYSQLSKEFQNCFALEDFKRDANGKPMMDGGRYVKEPSRFFHIFNRTEWLKDRWKLKLYGHQDAEGNPQFDLRDEVDSAILDTIELYDVQDPVAEFLTVGFPLW
jgi:hypothetical protein